MENCAFFEKFCNYCLTFQQKYPKIKYNSGCCCMKNKDVILLRKILEYCTQIEEACNMFENDYERFVSVSVFRNVCCMCILQIGELCKTISRELREKESEVPWREWCGVRDIFAHQYSNLDYQSAWETIREDVPELKEKVLRILDKSEQ